MKYRVHTYQVVCVSYEVEADSAEQAKDKVEQDCWNMIPVYIGDPLEEIDLTGEFIVDPILDNGEVDYDNVQFFAAPVYEETTKC